MCRKGCAWFGWTIRPARPRIGLVVAGHEPEPMLARALVEIARDVDVRGELDRVLARHL